LSSTDFVRVLRKIEREFGLVIFVGRKLQKREPIVLGSVIHTGWYPLSLHKVF